MKKSFNPLSLCLLACLILIGSILNIHSDIANFESESESAESSRRIEDISDSIIPSLIASLPDLVLLVLSHAVYLSENDSDFHPTVFQLLCSNRIALPPPSLS